MHRTLGADISFVRSLKLDTIAPEKLSACRGNEAANRELEFHCHSSVPKPHAGSTRPLRELFIIAKYRQRLFVRSDSQSQPHAPTIDSSSRSDESQPDQSASSSVGMREFNGILNIHLKSADNLPKADAVSDTDAYVKFLAGEHKNQRAQSKCVQDDNSPEWNERLHLSIANSSEPVRIEVWDEDTVVPDERICTAQLDLSSLATGQEETRTIQLFTSGSYKRDSHTLSRVPLLKRFAKSREFLRNCPTTGRKQYNGGVLHCSFVWTPLEH